jgi:uncharacterized membrane protein YdfJ with MMPL/SSD domain
MPHPAVSVALSGGLLVAAAIPAFNLSTKFPSITDLPSSIPIVKTFDRVEKAFPGSPVPMIVVLKGRDLNTFQVEQGVLDMRDQALATGRSRCRSISTSTRRTQSSGSRCRSRRPTAEARRPTAR